MSVVDLEGGGKGGIFKRQVEVPSLKVANK